MSSDNVMNLPDSLLGALGGTPANAPIGRAMLALVAAFGLGTLCTYITREVARRVGFVAKPRAERWHAKPTALAGGIGIFAAFAVTCLWVGGPLHTPLLAGATAMFVLGLIDDIVQLRPSLKLGGQLVVAAATVLTGPVLPWTPLHGANQFITVFWLVGVTNALNLLDNMDGLSGGVACIGSLVQGYFFLAQGQHTEAALCGALAGALGGFLLFNFNPASIFMGDAGSLFLGYLLASMALHQGYGRSRGLVTTIAGPVLLLLIPIFDTTFVSVTRTLRGRPISQGGRDHTSHRLVLLGLSERSAVVTLWGLTLFSGLMAILLRHSVAHALYVGIPIMLVGLMLMGVQLARSDYEKGELGQGRGRSLMALGALGYKLRLFEALLDGLLAMASLGGAFLLRFDGDVPDDIEQKLYKVFPALVASKLLALYLSGSYDGVWQHTGPRDLLRLARGALLGSVFGVALISLMVGFRSLSRGALILDALLFTFLAVCARASFRALHGAAVQGAPQAQRRVLLWGSDEAGELLVRQLSSTEALLPVGYIDDNELKHGCTIRGLPVLGSSRQAVDLLRDGVADEVLITSPAIVDGQVAELVRAVGDLKVRRLRISLEPISLS